MDADTVNREPSLARKAIGWWQRQGWIACDPTVGIERRPAPPDRTKALSQNQIASLWRLEVKLRDKTFWKMLYESAARAEETLCLNVEDLLPDDKRGKITAKGGATGVDPLAVRHRPAAAPPDRRPHPGTAVPHRPPRARWHLGDAGRVPDAARDAMITGRRPIRSDSGPHTRVIAP